jgi:hypothetical protein
MTVHIHRDRHEMVLDATTSMVIGYEVATSRLTPHEVATGRHEEATGLLTLPAVATDRHMHRAAAARVRSLPGHVAPVQVGLVATPVRGLCGTRGRSRRAAGPSLRDQGAVGVVHQRVQAVDRRIEVLAHDVRVTVEARNGAALVAGRVAAPAEEPGRRIEAPAHDERAMAAMHVRLAGRRIAAARGVGHVGETVQAGRRANRHDGLVAGRDL